MKRLYFRLAVTNLKITDSFMCHIFWQELYLS